MRPLVANEITAEQAFERGCGPLRDFMEKNVREKGLLNWRSFSFPLDVS